MKKSKFGKSYPLAVKKIALQYPDFFIEDINTTYWAFSRDVEKTCIWLDKCRTGEAHVEMGIPFEGEETVLTGWEGWSEEEIREAFEHMI